MTRAFAFNLPSQYSGVLMRWRYQNKWIHKNMVGMIADFPIPVFTCIRQLYLVFGSVLHRPLHNPNELTVTIEKAEADLIVCI